MSRFSKSEAEALGWVFVHEQDEQLVLTSETQQEHRVYPASYRAEKYIEAENGDRKLIDEEADSMGLLLERIHAYEEQLKRKAIVHTVSEPPTQPEEGETWREDVLHEHTVTAKVDGELVRLSESEWADRDRREAIYKDGQMTFIGGGQDEVLAERRETQHEIENFKTAEPEWGETEQIVYDTADTIDSPGQSAGGTIVVRAGEDRESESIRRDAEKHELENERVVANLPSPDVETERQEPEQGHEQA